MLSWLTPFVSPFYPLVYETPFFSSHMTLFVTLFHFLPDSYLPLYDPVLTPYDPVFTPFLFPIIGNQDQTTL